MMESIADRIRQRMKVLKLSQRETARLAGIPESTLRNIFAGKSESPRGVTLRRLAEALQTTERWLVAGEEEAAPETPPSPASPSEFRLAEDVPIDVLLRSLPKDVPVMGTVAGSELGKGAFQLTNDIVDFVRRPYGLLGAKDIYALYVEGESMQPKFQPGDLVFVHPHRKARNGDYVVVQEPDSDRGEPRGFIKRLVAVTAKLIRTEQFNPPAKIDFVIRSGTIVHKVVTDGELYGV
jgi:phage repressor protein C with HTH and peptisase S24 domain